MHKDEVSFEIFIAERESVSPRVIKPWQHYRTHSCLDQEKLGQAKK
jgi:hypothetical protein